MDQVIALGEMRLKILRAVSGRALTMAAIQQQTGISAASLSFVLRNMRGLVSGNPDDLSSLWTITAAGAGVLAVNDPRSAGAYI